MSKKLVQCGYAIGQPIVAGGSAVGFVRFFLKTATATSRLIMEIGPKYGDLSATIAPATPSAMPRTPLELLPSELDHRKSSVAFTSMFNIGLAHVTPPIGNRRSLSLYGQYCKSAARSARFEHGESGYGK
jgi:hypothetical protein